MNRINASLSAFALAAALFSTSSCTQPSSNGASTTGPSGTRTSAFHVIGLMKTQSGAT